MTVISFQRSVEILLYHVERNQDVRAYKSSLAKAARIQKSYLSALMKGEAYLSLDQAALLAEFWQLDEIDTEYFLTLCIMERATVPSLVKRYRDRAQELRKMRNHYPKTQFDVYKLQTSDSISDMEEFCSDWRFSAVLSMTHFPNCSPSFISRSLDISLDSVESFLKRLEAFDLVTFSNNYWIPSKTSNGRALRASTKRAKEIFHSNIRDKAESRLREGSDGIHSTGIYALSKEEFQKVNSMLHEFIRAQSDALRSESPPDMVTALCIDLFTLT